MKKYLLGLFLGVIFLGGHVAYADMLITPTQVVFEGRDRFATITLVNTSQRTNSYEFGWEYFNMKNGGGGKFELSDKPATEFDLSKHIVFAPKRVTLAPGARQKLRLALRRPAEVSDGDYHVHLKFLSVPNEEEELEKPKDEKVKGASMGMNIIVNYAIPVVFRSGEVNVNAEMGDITLFRNEKSSFLDVDVPIFRSGDAYSILGSLSVYNLTDDGQEVLVGELSNAYIFPEADDRIFRVMLTKKITGGSLRIVLHNYDKKNYFTYVERIFAVE